MENSNEKVIDNLVRLYTNVFNLMVGFEQATSSNNLQKIDVELMDENGNMDTVTINSIQNVISSLNRIDSNFNNLLNTDNISYVVNGDGSLSQVTKTTFMNNEFISKMTHSDNCFIDRKNAIKELVFPNVKLPIEIDTNIITPIRAKIYEIFDGFDEIRDGAEIIDIEYMKSEGIISVASEYEIVLELEKEKVDVFGEYDVIEAKSFGDITDVILNKTSYKTINSQLDNMELSVGDLLSTKDGVTLYEIISIHNFSKKVKLKRIKGINNVTNGLSKLSLNKRIDTGKNIVGIPIQPQKKLVIFLSTENIKTVSFPSKSIKFNTATFNVTQNNVTYSLDEYFNKYVINISDYLTSMINETSIPLTLGIKPITPILLDKNFKVVQINKHLTDAKSNEYLLDMNKKKEKIKNDINYKESEIKTLQNNIDTQKFRTEGEKLKVQNNIVNLRTEVNELNATLLTIARDLDSNAIQYGLKDSKPKFRVIGFWDIQQPMFSPSTKPQHIIKYEIQYRYLTINLDTVDSTSYTMINNEGKEVNVTISNWNMYDSETLSKVQNLEGEMVWENQNIDSSEVIKINQLSISINEGESVEIRMRAISEAGYPIAPLKSEWSDTLRINFPNGLIENAINTVVNKNENDLKKQEFYNVLQKSGILNHISNEIIEGDKIYLHRSEDISSGFYTNELKTIPLSTFLQTLRNDVNTLIGTNIREQITVELTDFNGETIGVLNNTTIELSAGNYTDELNLLDDEKFGSIIRKTAYIKISNKTTNPLEVRSLVSGATINSNNAPKFYNVPVRMPDGSMLQNSKQILYFRNVDITGQDEESFRLITQHKAKTTTVINSKYIDVSANEETKDTVFLDSNGEVKLVKLLPNAGTDFVAFNKKHPLYDSENLNKIKPEFDRIQYMTDNLRKLKVQEEPILNGKGVNYFGFNDMDKYAVGANTVGAYLYPIFNNINTISVVGNTSISTLIIPEKSDIMIPFNFEYRMTDADGKINADKNLTINDDLIYSKTIGVDLLINLINFRFDITVTSRLKSNVQNIETLNVSSIAGSFKNESKEFLI